MGRLFGRKPSAKPRAGSTIQWAWEYSEKLAAKGDLRGLSRALGDPDPNVRESAARELGHAAMAVLDLRLASLGVADYGGLLWRIRPSGLVPVLGLDRGQVDANALRRAREILTEPLVAMLNEEAQGSRESAAEAARAFCDERAVEPLIAILGDAAIHPALGIRNTACDALVAIGDARAVEPLAREISVNVMGKRERAGKALALLGVTAVDVDAVVDELIRCFPERNAGWVYAEEALRRLHTPRAQQHLAAFEAKERALREQEQVALKAMPSSEQRAEAVQRLETAEAEILERTAESEPATIDKIIEGLLDEITNTAGLGDVARGPLVSDAKEAGRKAAGRYATDHRDSLKGDVDPRPFADKLVRPAVAAYLRVLKTSA